MSFEPIYQRIQERAWRKRQDLPPPVSNDAQVLRSVRYRKLPAGEWITVTDMARRLRMLPQTVLAWALADLARGGSRLEGKRLCSRGRPWLFRLKGKGD